MSFDVIFSGGLVVDGTGAAPRVADVGVSGDVIQAVGDLGAAEAGERIDCKGLAVAPGFIDIHTHYDPQILWDAELTPSSWYGVTTVVMGNCGFTIAPLRASARNDCIDVLSNVEAMSPAALHEGIDWSFESFGDYLRVIEARRPALNVAALVGHTALRLNTLEAPAAREATADEIKAMRDELERSMAAGAWGFSTSKSPSHVSASGHPAPSRLASLEELSALAGVLGEARAGVIQGVGGPGLGVEQFAQLSKASGRTLTWCSLHQGVGGGRHWELSRETAQAREAGADIWAQMGCLPIVSQFNLERPYSLEALPAFAGIAGRPRAERVAALTDKAWQAEVERQIAANEQRITYDIRWDRMSIADSPSHPELAGRTLADIAGAGRSGLDAFVQLSIADDFKTRVDMVLFNWDEAEVARLLAQDSTLLGLSDAGAHASQLCDATYALHLLSRFVRERRDFSLEFAVWRLTGHPAQVFGVKDRGHLRPGFFADVCVFDPARVGESAKRRVHDLPAGADRVLKDPIGVEHVMVNGRFIRRDGANRVGTGAGRVLKH